ncbi:hypothetical protein [Streptomyces sp. NPDC097610]|uniref:hypothetical protein n=1 Tax=Streptomyces sp. NPDC097610 TaxID=3157227 RepID=UPI003325977F
MTVFGVAGTGGVATADQSTALQRSSFDGTLTADAPEGTTIGYSSALSADGSRVVMGAPVADGYNGAAYVYARTRNGWTKPAVLKVPGTQYQEIGFSVAISGDGCDSNHRQRITFGNQPGKHWIWGKNGSLSSGHAGVFYSK